MAGGESPEVSGLRSGKAGDRPWLQPSATAPDRAGITAWRNQVDTLHSEIQADLTADGTHNRVLTPGVSVVIPSYKGVGHIRRCLDSLAEQTLDRGLIELIVVLNGPEDGTHAVLDDFRAANPGLAVRVVRLNRAGASRARNAGIAAARREYTTFVDDDDRVSPEFLEVLYRHASPQVVPIAGLVNVRPDGTEDAENPINTMLVEHAGKITAPAEARVTTTFNACKLVATSLLRDVYYDTDLASGEDVLFWMTVVVRGHINFYPCPTEGAIYYRELREGSVSRPEPTFDFYVTQRLEVITRLERLLPECDVRSKELLATRIRAQTAFLAEYLKVNPGEYGRVVEEIDRYPIFHMPYERMNGGLERGLVIAYAFPPYADTSAVVMGKRVRMMGRTADVIYNAMDRIRPTDESLTRISGPFINRKAALPTPSYFSDFGSMEKFALAGLKQIEQWQQNRRNWPYPWIYSRAQFAHSHFLAAAYKLANPKVRWTAEFSDPLSRDIADQERGTPVKEGVLMDKLRNGLAELELPIPESTNCFVWTEEIAYALADEIIFTNENQMEYMLSYCSSPELAEVARQKAVVSPHPTLSPNFYQMVETDYALEPGVANIAYFGNFYATRGLDDVLAAIAAQDTWTRAHLRMHVFTTKPEELQKRAAELGISDAVRVGPYARFLEFLNLTTKFDCLLVNDAVTGDSHAQNPYLPSKWSDYKGSGSPVWGLVEEGSPLSRQPLHYQCPVGDVAAATEIIAQIVRNKVGERPYDAAPAGEWTSVDQPV
ncbi:glycosyltransferase [Micromonospora mirobrigensis]|uniref:Glycosyl transferase family 2 n=1 Tax=Micromonospora mirobrigensis TaxID=262898 RepID=A0A1C4UGU4_9ACTN|nr:glycosyltransferase [Micromonospora mirobrigensis]SCE70877.1 Glycosyl transferase family 2 [Micromonospora mirobrigensis]